MGSTFFRDPQARSSALATLRTLQPRAFGSPNRIDPLDLVSNYYVHVCVGGVGGGGENTGISKIQGSGHQKYLQLKLGK